MAEFVALLLILRYCVWYLWHLCLDCKEHWIELHNKFNFNRLFLREKESYFFFQFFCIRNILLKGLTALLPVVNDTQSDSIQYLNFAKKWFKNGKYRFKNWIIHSFHDKIQFKGLFNIIFSGIFNSKNYSIIFFPRKFNSKIYSKFLIWLDSIQ